ncbi:MAG: PAS domain S-box protein [Gemmatimonadota bacterium]|nr:MAG: PAS domain S-box protein [Gemmatimonadota bacterium]
MELTILDSLPDPIFFVDRQSCVVYLNRACESAFGLSAADVKGRLISDVLGSDLDKGLLALLSPAPRRVNPASLPAVRIGRVFCDVRVTPGSAGVTAVYCMPPSGPQARWPELVADSADAIWAVDDEEHIIAWNRGAEEMFGYASDEIIGQPVARLIPADLVEAREPERLRKALRELGAVRDYQTRRVRKDGREVEVSLTSTVARNGSANSLASSTIVRDLSQRRQIERQAIESEKLVTLGQLAASVAHEIGAPLTSIGIVVESLRKSELGDCDAEKQLETAAQQLSRIARLTHGLVELAKPGELRLARVRLFHVIDRVLELLEASLKRASIEVAVDCPASLPEIAADAGQLQQVFLNLVMNAQRALESTSGGVVTVEAKLDHGLPVVGRPMREVIKIELGDNGPGIDPADLPYIFAPFFSRSGGSGLGLALAKQIVHAHGGTIEARSTLGSGATFTILLPVESDA